MKALIEKIILQKYNYGTAIEYILDPDENINSFSNGMMTHNNIKGIMGYIYEANNGVRKLRFNQPDGIALSLLLSQRLSKQVLLTVLSNIADIISRADEYMLDEKGFAFDSRFIFVNTANLNADMLYVPTDVFNTTNYSLLVKDIIYSSIVNTNEDTTYIRQIANCINEQPNIPSKELGNYIKSLLKGTVPPQQINPVAPASISVNQPYPVQNNQQSQVQNNNSIPNMANPSFAAPSSNIPQQSQQTPPKAQKGGLFSGHNGKKKTEKPPKTNNSNKFGFNLPGQNPASMPIPPTTPNINSNPTPSINQTAPSFVQQPGYSVPMNNVAVVSQETDGTDDGKTVLLKNEADNSCQKHQVFLEKSNGEKIFITKSMFFIGKSDKSEIPNDYIVKNNAVSRNHAYFQLNANSATVTDNNSSNGTFINGERIPSMVTKELKNGDIVKLANEEFVFRVI